MSDVEYYYTRGIGWVPASPDSVESVLGWYHLKELPADLEEIIKDVCNRSDFEYYLKLLTRFPQNWKPEEFWDLHPAICGDIYSCDICSANFYRLFPRLQLAFGQCCDGCCVEYRLRDAMEFWDGMY